MKPGSQTTKLLRVQYGATIERGDILYLDAADSKYKLTDTDALATAMASGVAMTPGVDTDYGFIATDGLVNMGGTLAAGQTYSISVNAGKFCPLSDLASGDFPRIIGQAASAALLDLDFIGGGVAKA